MKYRIFPAHKNGRCLKGFCPTLVDDDNADRVIFELASDLFVHNIKYDHIVAQQYE